MRNRQRTTRKLEKQQLDRFEGSRLQSADGRKSRRSRLPILWILVGGMCLFWFWVARLVMPKHTRYMVVVDQYDESAVESIFGAPPRVMTMDGIRFNGSREANDITRLVDHYRVVEWEDSLSRRMRYPDDPRTRPSCEFVGPWETQHRPMCSKFHEIDLKETELPNHHEEEAIRLVNSGAFRDVWMVRDYDGKLRALKTLRYSDKRHFDLRNQDRHRRDALVFDELSSSPLVVDIYGQCANSALFDFSSEGNLYNIFDFHPSKAALLNVAYEVAASVEAAHHHDAHGRPSIAHTDIKPDQWILVDGKYKLNDFNRARLLTWDTERDEVCPFRVGKNGGIWRSPEEYNYQDETHKVDVWSLGNVLYFLLTGKEPFADVSSDEAIDLVQAGKRPEVVEASILSSTHPYEVAMLEALELCFRADPKSRPEAHEIVAVLDAARTRLAKMEET